MLVDQNHLQIFYLIQFFLQFLAIFYSSLYKAIDKDIVMIANCKILLLLMLLSRFSASNI